VGERRPGRAIADGVVEPPADADPRELAPEVRAELRSLAPPVAERVARHLVATAQLLDEDPDAALAQARAARAFGARLGSVREAAGIAAYRAGEWAEAIAELRTARRLTGDGSHLPLIADSERALGRPERALTLARSAEATALPAPLRAEMRIVESGARRDLGQLDAGLVALEGPDLDRSVVRPWSARLRYAYADLLLALGREQAAREWFVAAAAVDTDGTTDAAERLLDLDGFTLDVADDDADDYADEDLDVAEDDIVEEWVGEDDRDDAGVEDGLDSGPHSGGDDVAGDPADPPVDTVAEGVTGIDGAPGAEAAGGPPVPAVGDNDASAGGGSEPGAVTSSAKDAVVGAAGPAGPEAASGPAPDPADAAAGAAAVAAAGLAVVGAAGPAAPDAASGPAPDAPDAAAGPAADAAAGPAVVGAAGPAGPDAAAGAAPDPADAAAGAAADSVAGAAPDAAAGLAADGEAEAGPAEELDAAGDGAVHGAGDRAADATGREALAEMEAAEAATEAAGPATSDAGPADPPVDAPGTAGAGGRSFPALVFSSPEAATPAVSQPVDAPRPGSPIAAVQPEDPAGSDQGRS